MGRRATYNKPVTEEKASLFEDEELFDKEPTPTQEEAPKKFNPDEYKAEKKEFKDTDKISCVSITVGGLNFVGDKSGDLYQWTNIGDVVNVEYRDLLSAVRSHSVFVYEPRFVIQDEDFLAQHDDIIVRYGQLYTPQDIEQVLAMPAPQLEKTLKKMPVGAQNAVRDLAVRKIDSGELDSVQRVKVIDAFFGTELILKLTQ